MKGAEINSEMSPGDLHKPLRVAASPSFQTQITFSLSISLNRPHLPLKILSAPNRVLLIILSQRWILTLQEDKFYETWNQLLFSLLPHINRK